MGFDGGFELGFGEDDGVGAPGGVSVEASSVVGGNQQAAVGFPCGEGSVAGVPVGQVGGDCGEFFGFALPVDDEGGRADR